MHSPSSIREQAITVISSYEKPTINYGIHILSQTTTHIYGFLMLIEQVVLIQENQPLVLQAIGANCISWSVKKQPTILVQKSNTAPWQ